MQLKADVLCNSIYVMNKYLYKAYFTDYIRCQCESIFTVRELRQFCGNAFFLRESRPVPHLKFLIPLPPRSRGIPADPMGLPFGALKESSTQHLSLFNNSNLNFKKF
jgi:hypothetical protein